MGSTLTTVNRIDEALLSQRFSGHEFSVGLVESIPAVEPKPDPARGPRAARLPDFQAVYKQYTNFVWSTARALGAIEDTIDDVVQDVFLVVHAKLSTLQHPESLSSWLYGITRRILSDYRRAKRNRNAAEERLGAEIKSIRPAPATPLEYTERKAELDLLQRILLELNGPNREIFILVEILEMTMPQAVQTLGIPLDTAYSRLRRARHCFDKALATYGVRDGKRRQAAI